MIQQKDKYNLLSNNYNDMLDIIKQKEPLSFLITGKVLNNVSKLLIHIIEVDSNYFIYWQCYPHQVRES